MADQLSSFFRKIRVHGNLVSGLRQVVKALEAKQGVKVVILANDCNENAYKALIKALCKKHGVSIVEKFPKKQIGELAGQFRLKGTICEEKTADARNKGKIVGASVLAITDFGTLTEEDQKCFNEMLQ
ncbi:Ribosomal protein S12 [Spironucleus salmonicida]|uniref:Ribosomal protein S12 n=1 Tax=Spironucleus salmonicida TaxID=348837 RepID=V6LJC2_9EUKA|nr:Ribosomal protein S12 [Spironucleus salmonicida]KAH0577188.1 Ribosomal protein S12 [Spironucleus salmonicida]|eukprot:EST43806.1 Ribosomal protein S12 [Spironucleus salmonicida]